MTQPDVDGVRPYLLVSAGALSEKIDALARLPREVWSSTLLADADADRVRDVLTQIRIGLEQGFINNGHSAALGRADELQLAFGRGARAAFGRGLLPVPARSARAL